VDWKTFRALETFAILYDIQIDEGQQEAVACSIGSDLGAAILSTYSRPTLKSDARKTSPVPPWEGTGYRVFHGHGGGFPTAGLTLSFELNHVAVRGWIPPTEFSGLFPISLDTSEDEVQESWRMLLLAKRARSELMKTARSSAFEALDALGFRLLAALPPLVPELEDDAGDNPDRPAVSDQGRQLALMRVLYLNEIAACLHGMQSIGFADQCLDLIKLLSGNYYSRYEAERDDDPREGQSPYELVALYNKAQGYLHIRKHEKALELFGQTVRDLGLWVDVSSKRSHYFGPVVDDPRSDVRWPEEGDERLFAAYVGFPAALQAVEALINLQCSQDARHLLEERLISTNEEMPWLTDYQSARAQILRERIVNDAQSYSQGECHVEWQAGAASKDIDLQRRAVLSERCSQLAAKRQLLCDRMTAAFQDRIEYDQTVLEWVKGLKFCSKRLRLDDLAKSPAGRALLVEPIRAYFLAVLPDVGEPWPEGLKTFRDAARELACDDEWRDHKAELTYRLLEDMTSLCDSLSAMNLVASDDELVLRETHDHALEYLGQVAHSLAFDAAFPESTRQRLWELHCRLGGVDLPSALPVTFGTPADYQNLQAVGLHSHLRRFLRHEVMSNERPAPTHGESACWWRCETKFRFMSEPSAYRCFKESTNSAGKIWSEPRACAQGHLLSDPLFGDDAQSGRKAHYWDLIRRRNQDEIGARLMGSHVLKTPSGWAFVVLQRWNSFTPAMAASEGGGYYLYWHGEVDQGDGATTRGLVVDPGYGFVKNFLGEGYGIKDIEAIVVTHDHPDHLADFLAIVNLALEVQKDRGGTSSESSRGISALLSPGAFAHLEPDIVAARDVFADTAVLDWRPGRLTRSRVRPWIGKEGVSSVEVRPTKAIHRDASVRPDDPGSDSIGLVVEVGTGETRSLIGIPSDTKYREDVVQQYSECDLVCVHLGSIAPEDFELGSYFLEAETTRKVLWKKDQLYLPGVLWLIQDLANEARRQGNGVKLVILSEFGEEMSRGLRVAVSEDMDGYCHAMYGGSVRVIPGDVGLLVDPVARAMRCSCCDHFFPWQTPFVYELYGESEQIFYVCPECDRSLSDNQKSNVFRRKQAPLMRMIAQ